MDATPLLLHACCGPCSLEPVRLLREEGFVPTIFWSNPNIQPVLEHERRLQTLRTWAGSEGIEVKVGPDDREAWERLVAPFGFDRERRCRACYALRLRAAVEAARDAGFTAVSTTLAVSPYQLFDACMETLEALCAHAGLKAIVRDFRPNYPDATRRSRELGMYRQNYSGCRFSAAEAQISRHEARDMRKRERELARRKDS